MMTMRWTFLLISHVELGLRIDCMSDPFLVAATRQATLGADRPPIKR